MKEVIFNNEKGNPIPKMRANINDVFMPRIKEALIEKFGEDKVFENATGGCFSIAVAIDKNTRETVFVRLEKTITTKDPEWKPAPKEKKAEENVDMAEFESLFE